MSKRTDSLSRYFKPTMYALEKNGDTMRLTITGQKLAPPSHRISLHQTGLNVIKAKVTRFDKHGATEIEVARINHLPTIQQVRLHGASIMYPGRYQIELDYVVKLEKRARLANMKPSRELMPSIDESDSWRTAEFEFKQ